MRIYFVTSEYVYEHTGIPRDGGLAQYLSKITVELVRRGNDVSVVCIGSEKSTRTEYCGMKVFFVPPIVKAPWWDSLLCRFMPKKRRIIRRMTDVHREISRLIGKEHSRCPIDIIQYASFMAMGRLPEKDIPNCVRISSYAKLWQRGYGAANPYEQEAETDQFKRAKFLYGPSRIVAEAISADVALRRPIEIIETPFVPYAGEENEDAFRELEPLLGGGEYLLFFGTIGQLKGSQEIAGSIREILSRHPSLHLVLVGKETALPDTANALKGDPSPLGSESTFNALAVLRYR